MFSSKKSKFSLPKNVTYLNCGYMSPLMKEVEKVGIKSVRRKRDPSSILPSDFFNQSNQLREAFAKLINAPDPSRIVIVPSASYGLSSAAQNIRIAKGDNIIVAARQFPSNYYPWQRLSFDTGAEIKSIEPPSDGIERGKRWNERILDAITSTTKVVALGNVHWADGTLFQLADIRKRTRDVGALLIIDGTQSIGALPFDLQKVQPDALVCAGYKWLLGPYAIGLAYYGEYFNDGRPIEESWMNRLNSEDFTRLNYEPQYQPGALRYEVGEHSNFNLVPMLLKSIEQLNKWGVGNIQSYCHEITQKATTALSEHGYWIESDAHRCAHLFGVRLNEKKDLQKLKEDLLKNKVFVSFRGDAIRVSPNIYNTPKDLAKFVKVMIR